VSTRITFHGAAAFDIEGPSHRILIDPFFSANPVRPIHPDDVPAPDLMLVTHAAADHYGDAAAIARRTGSPVVCGPDVRLMLLDGGVPPEQIRSTVWGIVVEVAGLLVRPVLNHHFSTGVLSTGERVVGQPLAFIVETEPGVRIYHCGDTAFFDQTLYGDVYRPTVGLLGCTTPIELHNWAPGPGRIVSGEMDADEAARTAEMLRLRVAVACHYLEPDEEAGRFVDLVTRHDTTGHRQAFVPRMGDAVVVDAGGARLEEGIR
jgi:L-ascorbate metabolism protein UlaG (beta-lactamase superfamily)